MATIVTVGLWSGQLDRWTYVRPIFDYSDVVYHGHLTVTNSLSLERIQNRAARFITGTFRRTSSSALLRQLGLTTLHSRSQINSLNIFFKTKQNAPRYLQEIITTTRLEITARKLRNSSNLTLPPNRVGILLQKPLHTLHNPTVE